VKRREKKHFRAKVRNGNAGHKRIAKQGEKKYTGVWEVEWMGKQGKIWEYNMQKSGKRIFCGKKILQRWSGKTFPIKDGQEKRGRHRSRKRRGTRKGRDFPEKK